MRRIPYPIYPHTKESGFTLIEMMLVVAIIGIIASIAIPNYNDYVQKSRRSDAKSMLMQIAANEEQYFMDNRSYTGDFTDLGYPNAASVTSENGHYTITINVPNSYEFTLTATPQGAQASDSDCTTFTLNNVGTKAHTGAAAQCW